MKKMFLVSFILILSLTLISCSFTTANFSDLTMASEIDSQNKPVVSTSTFSTDAPVIYVTGTVNNAPEGTIVTANWYYLEDDPMTYIDGVSLEISYSSTDFNFSLSRPDTGWPKGNYKVELKIDDTKTTEVTFKVE